MAASAMGKEYVPNQSLKDSCTILKISHHDSSMITTLFEDALAYACSFYFEVIGIIKRKALIKELAAAYHSVCLAHCQELLQLQRKWEQMGRKQEKRGASLNLIICENATLREENTGKKNVDKNSILKIQHLQRLATWAGGEARIPPLGAFLGAYLAAEAEASGIPLDHSTFVCQRCETVLQPGFNCTIRIEKCVNKGRWRKKAYVPCKNSVVYTCHFCSHQNVKWGTAEGHIKNIIASRRSQDSDSNRHCSTDKAHGKSENVLASKHEVRQDVGEDIPSKLEPVSELKSITPGRAAVTEKILAQCPSTPLEKMVNTSQRKGKVSDSIPNKLPVGRNHSAITDSEKGTGGSSKRRRKAWSRLKEITQKSELENAQNLSNFVIPFRI